MKRSKARTDGVTMPLRNIPLDAGAPEPGAAAEERWPQLHWHGKDGLRVGDVDFFLSIDPTTYAAASSADRFVLLKTPKQLDFFSRFVPTEVKNIVDLGIFKGGSIVLYQELFSPKRIVGLDLESGRVDALDQYVARRSLEDTVRLHYATDQGDENLVGSIIEKNFGNEPLDLVVDDASHMYEPTKASLNLLFPRLRPGGVYIIEDWGWAHWNDEFYQSKTHNFVDEKNALSKLILELVMVAASRPNLISEIHLRPANAYLIRGQAEVPRGFDIASSYLTSGRQLLK